MANKKVEQTIKGCDRQLEGLYTHFGKFLYENIEKEDIHYCFEPEDKHLEKEAGGLLEKIKCSSDSEKIIQAGLNRIDTSKFQAAGKETKQQKQKLAKGANQAGGIKPAEKRGLIEPYARLKVGLYEIKKKLVRLKVDVDEYLSLALLHISEAKTEEYKKRLKEIENKIISLIEKNVEVVEDIMEKKKKFIKDSQGSLGTSALKAEDEFLKNASADIKNTGRQIDALAKKAIGLFHEIKHSYEKDLEADRLLREEKLKGTKEDVVVQEEGQDKQEEQKEEEQEEERLDYGLLETASRRLKDKNVAEKDKLQVLNVIFRSTPDKAVAFLFDLIKDADLPLKKKLIGLLKEIGSPVIINLYREFINCEDPFLRLQAIMELRRMASDQARDVIMSAVGDPDSHIRRLVANCLNCPGSDSEQAAIIRLTNDSDETVARIALRKLGRAKSRLSFVNLVPKLESPNIKIRKEAIEALRFMTGTDLGYRYSAPESERRVSVRNWQKLWKRNLTNPTFLQQMISKDLLVKTNKGARLSGTRPSKKKNP